MDLSKVFSQGEVSLIDVREPYEFETGHAKNAINIPLSSILESIEVLKSMQRPIVVYCRSGMRSGQAQNVLQSAGFKEVYNGGSLQDVEFFQKQKQSV